MMLNLDIRYCFALFHEKSFPESSQMKMQIDREFVVSSRSRPHEIVWIFVRLLLFLGHSPNEKISVGKL